MCFTRRRIPHIPQARIAGTVIPFRTTHRFLGLVLDGPRLTWRPHVHSLKASCLPRLDLMRALAGVKWGASRATLLRFYRIFIRSRIEYGCEVYGSASSSLLHHLEVVQNTALRIALGAFKSSPVTALLAESGLPSLDHKRRTLTVTTFHKLTASPHHSLHTLLSQHRPAPLPAPPLLRPHSPFITRALSFYATLSVSPPSFHPIAFLSPRGPWFSFSSFVSVSLPAPWTKADCPDRGRTLFLSLFHSVYRDYTSIFTDGSCVPSPASTSAAFYVPSLQVTTTWRLHPKVTILGAELFAIREGLAFALSSLPPHVPLALFTDSLTALRLLSAPRPRTHLSLCFAIHTLLLRLSSGGRLVRLQWVPSHVGISGNAIADRAANLAHSQLHPVAAPPDHSDTLSPPTADMRCPLAGPPDG